MNRFGMSVLCALLVLVLAGQVLAGDAKTFDVGGKILYRGRLYNLDFNNDSDGGSLNRRNYYGDLTLTMKFNPSDDVSACFEWYKMLYGTGLRQYNTIQTGETVTGGPWAENEDENWEGTWAQAWGQVQLPFAPVSVKMGRQPIMLGGPPGLKGGLYLNTGISKTFAIVVEAKDKIQIGTVKLYEGRREPGNLINAENKEHDDADINFVTFDQDVDDHKVRLMAARFTDNSSVEVDAVPGMIGRIKRSTINIGAGASGKLAGQKYMASVDYMVGKDEAKAGGQDVDIAGFAAMANVGLPAVGKLGPYLEVGMGSGDDPETLDKNEGYIPPGPFYPYAWAYEYRFIHWIHNSSRFRQGTVGVREALAPGLENTTYVKLGGAVKLRSDLVGAFGLTYLMATQACPIMDNNGAEFDTGKDIGIEADIIANYMIGKNFMYQFIFAYILPGGFWDGRIKGFDASNNPIDPDPAWGIRSQFQFTF